MSRKEHTTTHDMTEREVNKVIAFLPVWRRLNETFRKHTRPERDLYDAMTNAITRAIDDGATDFTPYIGPETH